MSGPFSRAFTAEYVGGAPLVGSLADSAWQLRVGGVDVSTTTGFDFTVTTGRRDADTQPDPGDASFTVHDVAGDAGWARAGEPVVLSVVVAGDPIPVASMVVSKVSKTFQPTTGTWRVALSCIGPLAGLARKNAGAQPSLYPEEGDVTRIVRFLAETSMSLDYRQSDTNRIVNDATGAGWTRAGTMPVSLSRQVPRAWGMVDVRVTVSVDRAARLILWAFGRTVSAIDVYTEKSVELRGMGWADGSTPLMVAVIAGGLLDPNAADEEWQDLPESQTWANANQSETWDPAKQPIEVSVTAARMWNADLPSNTVGITAREPQEGNAGQLVTEVAQAARGVLWETATGGLRYESPTDRNLDRFPLLTLNADLIVGATTAEQDTGDLANTAIVSYGYPDPGDSQRTATKRSNLPSVDRYGVYELALDGPLANRADARATADRLVLARGYPTDRLGSVQTLDSSRLPLGLAKRLLRAPLGALLRIDGAARGWLGEGWEGYLEGWTLTGKRGRVVSWDLVVTPRRDYLPLIPQEPTVLAGQPRALDVGAVFNAVVPGRARPLIPAAQFALDEPAKTGGLWAQSANGELQAWNGTHWVTVAGKARVTTSTAPPSRAKPGDVWVVAT